MIIFLNGPFGVGKTTVARVLAERLPDSLLFDPEMVGAFLRDYLLREMDLPEDFQDIRLWPPLTVELARMIVEAYGKRLCIPMTVWRRERAVSMRAGFEAIDTEVFWLQLTAPRDVLVERIEVREDAAGEDRSWWFEHLDSGLAMEGDPVFGTAISTEGRSADEVAEEILGVIGRGGKSGESVGSE